MNDSEYWASQRVACAGGQSALGEEIERLVLLSRLGLLPNNLNTANRVPRHDYFGGATHAAATAIEELTLANLVRRQVLASRINPNLLTSVPVLDPLAQLRQATPDESRESDILRERALAQLLAEGPAVSGIRTSSLLNQSLTNGVAASALLSLQQNLGPRSEQTNLMAAASPVDNLAEPVVLNQVEVNLDNHSEPRPAESKKKAKAEAVTKKPTRAAASKPSPPAAKKSSSQAKKEPSTQDGSSAEDSNEEPKGRKTCREQFPEKLYRVLLEVEEAGRDDVISFVNKGTAFEIHQPDVFESEIIPRYFRQCGIGSFKRQLHLYGFTRLKKDSRGFATTLVFHNPQFIRGKQHLCLTMGRVNKRPPRHAKSNPTAALPK